jgi:hypothetical protein
MAKLKQPKRDIPIWLWRLFLEKERNIVSMFESEGWIKPFENSEDRKFDNIILTDLGQSISKSNIPIITEEYVAKFKNIFPKRKGSFEQIRQKLIRLIMMYPGLTLSKILQLAEKYVRESSDPRYTVEPGYFIFKREPDGTERCLIGGMYEDETFDSTQTVSQTSSKFLD